MKNTDKIKTLLTFWEKLTRVSRFILNAKTKLKEDNGCRGSGAVVVTKERNHILIFHEKGTWQENQISFSNVFRWTLDQNAGVISLEQLRRGPDYPIFLVHLAPFGQCCLSSLDTHLCERDTYFGQIYLNSCCLCLRWRVIGPKKNEEINCYYS